MVIVQSSENDFMSIKNLLTSSVNVYILKNGQSQKLKKKKITFKLFFLKILWNKLPTILKNTTLFSVVTFISLFHRICNGYLIEKIDQEKQVNVMIFDVSCI